MTLKEYLKKVCDLEQKKCEMTLKLEKANTEYVRVQNKVKEENELQKKELKELEENNNKKIKELKDKKAKLEQEKSKNHTGCMEEVIHNMWVTMIISIIAISLIAVIVLKLFEATTASDVLLPYIIIYLVLVCSGYFLFADYEESTFSQIFVAILAFAFLLFITWGYFKFFESMGISLLFSNIIFAVIVLLIEAFVFFCKYQSVYSKEQRWLRTYRKDHSLLETKIMAQEELNAKAIKEKQNKNNVRYKDSKRALNLMQNEIIAIKNTVADLNRQINAMYAQNLLHPNYQNWIAASTIYDYLDTGMCYELKGPNGAYKLYEQAKIARKIFASFDEIKACIKNHSDALYESQRYMHQQINLVSRKLDQYVFNTYDY